MLCEAAGFTANGTRKQPGFSGRAVPALISGCILFVVFFAARNLEAAVDLFEEDGSHHLVREGHVGEGELHVCAIAYGFGKA